MKRVKYPDWDDDYELVIDSINEVALQISQVITILESHGNYAHIIDELFINIELTLDYWTGHTYVGCEKNEGLKQAFQGFFESLLMFILLCQRVNDSYLNDFAKSALYQGTVYRYLGYSDPIGNTKQGISPRYDGIYVSWSKSPKNTYLESKLYGTITKLTCLIDNDYYGIDLEPFGVVRGNESEVVFPTIEQAIKCIEYIEEESYDDTSI